MGFVTAKKISEKYAIPLMTVYYYSKRGMPVQRIQGRIKFDEQAVDRWVRGVGDTGARKKVW